MIIMNGTIVDIIFLAVFVIFILVDWKRGFAESLLSSGSKIIALILSFIFGNRVGEILFGKIINETLSVKVADKITELSQNISGKMSFDNLFSNPDESFLRILNLFNISLDDLASKYSDITDATTNHVTEMANTIVEKAVSTITGVLGCIVVFLAVLIILLLVRIVLKKVNKLPVIKNINAAFGALLGAISGLIVIWIICQLMAAIAEINILGQYDSYIQQLVSSSFVIKSFTSISFFELENIKNLIQ